MVTVPFVICKLLYCYPAFSIFYLLKAWDEFIPHCIDLHILILSAIHHTDDHKRRSGFISGFHFIILFIDLICPFLETLDRTLNWYLQFDQAARLYFYAGDFADARKMMERAAEVAEATGDMVSAAYRHVDAAFIAVWEGYPGSRRDHVRAAEEYAASPDMAEADAERIHALTRGVASLPVKEES